ncbi:glucose-6-phosphate isomerase [Polaribacter pacificus]|uniref:Glucose-6-phosphate isomerase n=1 Tax=Polaribacter pacificus TaxID=1775173 RepID=A0A917HW67_9FLAO|nr:glucose-6-phosphate isomerase [Polaribacter pacificus]GGG91706.1 glucose-6-phosphate isomerase [Polaribacter pacificus]
MALKNIDPTTTIAWKKLNEHFLEIQEKHLINFFKDHPNRATDFTIDFEDFFFDYSKNRLNQEVLDLLTELTEEVALPNAIASYFNGDIINSTEQRAVLHTALRSNSEVPLWVDGKNIRLEIAAALKQMESLTNDVVSGKWKGATGKAITDIVNIGIGGSHLGPQMVVTALQEYSNHLNTHFISNVDGDHLESVLAKLNRETTLFVIVSKTFSTQETLSNATSAKEWFLKSATKKDIAKHFIAVSTNTKAVTAFGVAPKNILPMWDWVGGRFSLWSPVGITISLSLGFEHFKQLLAGANEMDEHFKSTPFNKNIPVLMALIGIWYTNFFDCETELVLTYAQALENLVPYLQQASMESNGKSVDRAGKKIGYQTGSILWGGIGTNVQHSFMQLVHQGTKLIPADFIGFKESCSGRKDQHKKLMANYQGQITALAFGKSIQDAHLELKFQGKVNQISELLPYKVFEGNKPSNSLIIKKRTPESIGKLIALYEHKIFTQGIIWNIYSFDQFGVELGKELANTYLNQ